MPRRGGEGEERISMALSNLTLTRGGHFSWWDVLNWIKSLEDNLDYFHSEENAGFFEKFGIVRWGCFWALLRVSLSLLEISQGPQGFLTMTPTPHIPRSWDYRGRQSSMLRAGLEQAGFEPRTPRSGVERLTHWAIHCSWRSAIALFIRLWLCV